MTREGLIEAMTDAPAVPPLEAEPMARQAPLEPAEWQVRCPACERLHPVERVREQSSGAWEAADEDQFIPCECGILIECQAVQVLPLDFGGGDG